MKILKNKMLLAATAISILLLLAALLVSTLEMSRPLALGLSIAAGISSIVSIYLLVLQLRKPRIESDSVILEYLPEGFVANVEGRRELVDWNSVYRATAYRAAGEISWISIFYQHGSQRKNLGIGKGDPEWMRFTQALQLQLKGAAHYWEKMKASDQKEVVIYRARFGNSLN